MLRERQRKLNRWQGYDYSTPGLYFLTICTKGRICCFGEIADGKMHQNRLGKIADNFWREIPAHIKNCEIDRFTIMPNHIHGIIYLYYNSDDEYHENVGNANLRSLRNTKMLLPKIIQAYKAAVTREIKKLKITADFAWQKSFYDRVIRNEEELLRIREYIVNNPLKWEFDRNNPANKINIISA